MGSSGEFFAPSFTQKPKLRQEDDGNKLIFECKLLANPKPDIEWFRGDEAVEESKRVEVVIKPGAKNLFDVQLIVDDVEEEDAGLYKVKARNKYGEVAASINLNFSPVQPKGGKEQIDGIAPAFYQKPLIKQEKGGKQIVFEARIKGAPKPTIIWSRDDKEIKHSKKHQLNIEMEDGLYVIQLKLIDVTIAEAGKYKVTAKNELGESNANITLNFDSSFMSQTGESSPPPDLLKPIFVERPTIRQNEDGTKVFISCRCVGNPEPNVSWSFGGNKILDGLRHRVIKTKEDRIDYAVKLEISKVNKRDEGEYKILASNKAGEGHATVTLRFDGNTATDKPQIPDGKAPRFPKKPEIRQEGDKLLMECVLEANPEPEVAWYKGSNFIHEHGRLSMYKKICGGDQYVVSVVIKDPTPDDGGQWRCNAFNPFGDSNANISLNFKVTRKPIAPVFRKPNPPPVK